MNADDLGSLVQKSTYIQPVNSGASQGILTSLSGKYSSIRYFLGILSLLVAAENLTGCGSGGGGSGGGGSSPEPAPNNPPAISLSLNTGEIRIGETVTGSYEACDSETPKSRLTNLFVNWGDGSIETIVDSGVNPSCVSSPINHTYTGGNLPETKSINGSATDDGYNQSTQFVGNKTGTATKSLTIKSYTPNAPSEIGIGNSSGLVNQTVAVPIVAHNLSNVIQLDGAIRYDPATLQYNGYSGLNPLFGYTVGLSKDSNGINIPGKINLTAYTLGNNGVDIGPEYNIVNVHFTILSASTSTLTLVNAKKYDPSLSPSPVPCSNGAVIGR